MTDKTEREVRLPRFYTRVQCSQCGYDREYIATNGCPERCGRTASDSIEDQVRRVVEAVHAMSLDQLQDAAEDLARAYDEREKHREKDR
jgi:hypothetical protein